MRTQHPAGRELATAGSSAYLVEGDAKCAHPVGLRFYPGSTKLRATVEERTDAADAPVSDFFAGANRRSRPVEATSYQITSTAFATEPCRRLRVAVPDSDKPPFRVRLAFVSV